MSIAGYRRLALTRGSCALLAVLLAFAPAQANSQDEPAPSALSAPRADRAPEPLDLRLPTARPALFAATDGELLARQRPSRTVQLEPRKSFIERGVEGSREALIACQKGAYPGATVAAHTAAQTMGTEAQPDHCRRF